MRWQWEKMHIYGIYILDIILVTSFFCSDAKSIWATLILIIYPLRLNLVYVD